MKRNKITKRERERERERATNNNQTNLFLHKNTYLVRTVDLIQY